MKQSIYILLLFLISMASTNLTAQDNFRISEENAAMSEGSFNALVLTLDGANQKLVCKAWGKFVKRYKGKTKYSGKTEQYFTDEATIDGMSDNTVDIYAKISEQDEKTFVYVWFNLGVTYLSSSQFPERYPTGEKVLTDFGYYVSADLLEAQIKDKQKELRKEERDVKKIERSRKKYERKIEKAQKDIQKNEQKLDESKDELATQTKEVEEIEGVISTRKESLKQTKQILRKR